MPITKSSVIIARLSIIFFIILLIVNSLILFFVIKRLFFSVPGVNAVNSSQIVVTNYVDNLTDSKSSNIVKYSTPQPITHTYKYSYSNIGKYNRPFININNKMLTLGDYWDFGRILTITPYRIISLIPPDQLVIVNQDFFSVNENINTNTNSVENSNNMPFGGLFNEEN